MPALGSGHQDAAGMRYTVDKTGMIHLAPSPIGCTGTDAWDERLLNLDITVHNFKKAVSKFMPSQRTLDSLSSRVRGAIKAEQEALTALEAEEARQYEQLHRALRYSHYLDVLALHLDAASGGAITLEQLPDGAAEVRSALLQAGAPLQTSPLQVLHAYRLGNRLLSDAFEQRARAAADQLGPPTQRVVALRLPSGSTVEHVLVHGVRSRPAGGSSALGAASASDAGGAGGEGGEGGEGSEGGEGGAAGEDPSGSVERPSWLIDPSAFPEAGCVDTDTLAALVAASSPPPRPLALFAGGAAWGKLLEAEMGEAKAVAAAEAQRIAARGGPGTGALCDEPEPGQEEAREAAEMAEAAEAALEAEAAAEAAAAAGTVVGDAEPLSVDGDGEALGQAPRLLLLCRVLCATADSVFPAPRHGGRAAEAPAPVDAAPEDVLPLYLLVYGLAETSRPVGPYADPEHASEAAAAATAAVLAVSPEKRGKGKRKARRTEKVAAAAAEAVASEAAAEAEAKAAAAAPYEKGIEGVPLPPQLLYSREHADWEACRRVAVDQMRGIAEAFVSVREGIGRQLSPAIAAALVEDDYRIAHNEQLLKQAKEELAKMKKETKALEAKLAKKYEEQIEQEAAALVSEMEKSKAKVSGSHIGTAAAKNEEHSQRGASKHRG